MQARDVVVQIMNHHRFIENVYFLNKYTEGRDYLLAGGFLRDIVTRTPFKDLDIYMNAVIPGKSPEITKGQGDEHYDNAFILGQTTRTPAHWNVPINIVLCNSVIDHALAIDHFDIGLCKIAYHSSGKFIVSPDFMRDLNNKSLTVLRKDWGLEGVRNHMKRVAAKYPDYTIIDPEGVLNAQ